MTVKERLIIFIKSQSLSQRAFEAAIGVSNGYVNNIRQSIQPDKLQRIVLQYPNLNIAWLLSGDGEMLYSSQKSVSQMTDSEMRSTWAVELAKLYEQGVLYPAAVHDKIVGRLEARIEELVRENSELQRKLEKSSK